MGAPEPSRPWRPARGATGASAQARMSTDAATKAKVLRRYSMNYLLHTECCRKDLTICEGAGVRRRYAFEELFGQCPYPRKQFITLDPTRSLLV